MKTRRAENRIAKKSIHPSPPPQLYSETRQAQITPDRRLHQNYKQHHREYKYHQTFSSAKFYLYFIFYFRSTRFESGIFQSQQKKDTHIYKDVWQNEMNT